MNRMLIGLYVKAKNKIGGFVQNERGSQTLEWIGIAALIVIIVGALSQVFQGDTAFGTAIKTKLTGLVDSIGG